MGHMTERITSLATINDTLAQVGDPAVPVEDRAAMYGLLYAVKRRIDRALGTYQRKGPSAKSELAAHLATVEGEELGPLYLGWESFDVSWPCNDEGNWEDADVQEAMYTYSRVTPEFFRDIPPHFEVNTAALGEAVHMGDPAAIQLHRELKDRGWRQEGGKRAVLKVREVRA